MTGPHAERFAQEAGLIQGDRDLPLQTFWEEKMSEQLFDESGQPVNTAEETESEARQQQPSEAERNLGKDHEPAGELSEPDDDFQRLASKDVKILKWKAVDDSEVEVTIPQFGRFLMPDTSAGERPSEDDIVRTMMFCKAMRVDPWSRDCHIVGYSGYRKRNGVVVEPRWEVLVSHRYKESLAESHDAFAGIESGITVLRDGEIIDREGCQLWPGEELLGGWARVHRTDRRVPRTKRPMLSRFRKDSDFWTKSPGPEHMICKVAESQAYTAAFPKALGTARTEDEIPNDYRSTAHELKTIDATHVRGDRPARETVVGSVEE